MRTISYEFEFEDKTQWKYDLQFEDDQRLVPVPTKANRSWTKLEHHQCSHCPLKSSEHPQCPVARDIDNIIEESKACFSYKVATVTVRTPERDYVKTAPTQQGLQSIFGLIMASSACPHLSWLRPLARFHLPFAGLDETLFRVLSLQLLSEFFAKQRLNSSESAENLAKMYKAVQIVNHTFIGRIRSYCSGDADKNALAGLDLFVQLFELHQQSDFQPLQKYFAQQG